MRVYEVECGAVITIAAQDMQKAALQGAAVIKDNLHLIYVRAVHERNSEPTWEDSLTSRAECEISGLPTLSSSRKCAVTVS
jgi:hypothetical protein